MGFSRSISEPIFYVKNVGYDLLIITLYVDDLLVTLSNTTLMKEFKDEIHMLFEMTDMGEMSYFLGIEIHQNHKGIFICQMKYANEVLVKFGMKKASQLVPH